jgi:tetratricopeptide (TPR) repeat protein
MEDMPKAIGEFLNARYQLEAELGRGGMGRVYRAHDTLLDRDVAVKVLSAPELGAEGRARLLREARAAAGLNHANIVTVHDVGEADVAPSGDGLPFIVMELVAGPSLHDRRPESLEETVAVARQVCAALEHAHAHGIIHRDLKPENVLLALGPPGETHPLPGTSATAKLSDFGLARSMASRLTAEGAIAGTVFYLAPELALGQAYDGRADLYALGVMLYELATGRLPFLADDPLAVITQHLHAPPVPPRARDEAIPPALDALILRLLSKDPQDRPATAAEVQRALETPDILDREAIPARELSVLERIERGRLVGRERELAQMRALWQKAVAGEGQALLISGEPGIGKTRLVRELVTQVRVAGGRVLEGECYQEGIGPYAPFAQILRQAFEGGREEDSFGLPDFILADLLILSPALRLRYPDLPPNPALDPQAEQLRLFENVVALCTALSEQAPLLMVLEDAHWADGGTLSLLRHLARRTRRQRVMIVATYREVELDAAHPFHEVLLDLDRRKLATRLKLFRLGQEGTRDMLAALFAEEITTEFLEGIHRETEGNPFFVEEVCKALVESGRLTFEGGRWHRPGIEELGIPQSVRLAIQSRLGRLPAQVQETLCLAAIVGREFDFDTLAQASELAEEPLVDALERAERAQLIGELSGQAGGTFSFTHGLIPATVIEGLSGLRRRRLHGRVAAVLEALPPDDGTHLPALAYHYSQAGVEDKALHYLTRAGDQARASYANQDAVRYYSQALELAPEADDAGRYGLLLAREQVYDLLGERDAQRRDLASLEMLAHELGIEQQAEVAVRRAMYANEVGDYPAAMASARMAVEQARAAGRADLEALGHLRWAAALSFQSDQAAARGHAEAGLVLAQSAGLPSVEAHALIILGVVSDLEGDLPAAWNYSEQALHLYQEIGDRAGDLHQLLVDDRAFADVVLHNLGFLGCRLGNYAEAWARFRQNLQDSRERGDRRNEVCALWGCGYVRCLLGEYAQAQDYLEQSLGAAREIEDLRWEWIDLGTLCELHRRMGDFAVAREYAEQTLDLSREGGMPDYEGDALAALGDLCRDQGDPAAARDYYEQALRLNPEMTPSFWNMSSLAGLAWAALAQGDLAQAQAYAAEILAWLETASDVVLQDMPLHIYLTCYQVLRAGGDPCAHEILATAYRLLQERAARLSDEATRRSFLENVAENRDIVAEWEAQHRP